MLPEHLKKIETSVFQSSIRKSPLLPFKKFVRSGKIHPIAFRPSQLRLKSSERVVNAFSKTHDEHRNAVLMSHGIDKDPATGKRIAVLFSGGPASGGHNVLLGLKHILGKNRLFGVKNGPGGFLRGELFEIRNIDHLANTGGFEFLGTDRAKIKSEEELARAATVCEEHKLDAIIVIGGDDSNTNAAIMAEYLFDHGVQVIGVPKTMDGDLQVGQLLPISFGFDTATKIYSELVGNIMKDVLSAKKYWHFVRLMGRAASHVTLEVALQTRPTLTFISEEVAAEKLSLHKVVDIIVQCIVDRAKNGKPYGVVLVPEGLLEAIPEFHRMLHELGSLMVKKQRSIDRRSVKRRRIFLAKKLSPQNRNLFLSLPEYIQEMISLKRDAHGNVKLSQLPTEELLVDMVKCRMKEVSTYTHFFGYEGRCGDPTVFDAMFTYNLGLVAGSLILAGHTGYMAACSGFDRGGEPLAIPFTGIVDIENREGEERFVIAKRLVKLDDPAFRFFQKQKKLCSEDAPLSPGPRQMSGPTANQLPMTVALNMKYENLKFKV